MSNPEVISGLVVLGRLFQWKNWWPLVDRARQPILRLGKDNMKEKNTWCGFSHDTSIRTSKGQQRSLPPLKKVAIPPLYSFLAADESCHLGIAVMILSASTMLSSGRCPHSPVSFNREGTCKKKFHQGGDPLSDRRWRGGSLCNRRIREGLRCSGGWYPLRGCVGRLPQGMIVGCDLGLPLHKWLSNAKGSLLPHGIRWYRPFPSLYLGCSYNQGTLLVWICSFNISRSSIPVQSESHPVDRNFEHKVTNVCCLQQNYYVYILLRHYRMVILLSIDQIDSSFPINLTEYGEGSEFQCVYLFIFKKLCVVSSLFFVNWFNLSLCYKLTSFMLTYKQPAPPHKILIDPLCCRPSHSS